MSVDWTKPIEHPQHGPVTFVALSPDGGIAVVVSNSGGLRSVFAHDIRNIPEKPKTKTIEKVVYLYPAPVREGGVVAVSQEVWGSMDEPIASARVTFTIGKFADE